MLVFPGAHLDDQALLNFSRRFGPHEVGLKRGPATGLARLSNVTRAGQIAPPDSLQARFQVGNTHWHSDSSYKRIGAKASLLAAKVVPNTGGETEWADMRAAFEALDDETQHSLAGLQAVHDYRYSHAWHGGLELLNEEELAQLPPVTHPIVKTHPATGRKNLFVGRHASHIVGQDERESRARLESLTEAACQPPRVWKHAWQPGDLALWDNRCVLHPRPPVAGRPTASDGSHDHCR